MGLDVIFQHKGEDVRWDDPIMADFPFASYEEKYAIFDGEEAGEGVQYCIAEITGMPMIGSVSFRGRGYSHFASEVGLPDFYHDFSTEELKEQADALVLYLASFSDQPDTLELPGRERISRIRDLATLLQWAAKHNLSTIASF
jgi:hypothetical protein